uniref:HMG box domain-containing protein n=2 Tax=Rhodnius prolixus TaxID=13249 RepID=T1I663_RHOPR
MRQNDETKGLKLPEFVKFCANRWKELTESQKNQYKIKAAADKQRYADQKKKYQSMVPKIVKRPMAAFLHFCKKERPKLKAKHPEWTVPQISSELAKKWRCISETQKLKFRKIAQRERQRFKLRECKKTKADESTDKSDDESE